MVNAFRTLFVTVSLFAAALAAPKAARDTTDILAQLKGITGEFSTISTEITAFNNQGGNAEIAVVSNMLGSLPQSELLLICSFQTLGQDVNSTVSSIKTLTSSIQVRVS